MGLSTARNRIESSCQSRFERCLVVDQKRLVATEIISSKCSRRWKAEFSVMRHPPSRIHRKRSHYHPVLATRRVGIDHRDDVSAVRRVISTSSPHVQIARGLRSWIATGCNNRRDKRGLP